MVVPLAYLALRAAEADTSTLFDLVFRTRTLTLLWNTVRLGLGVVTLTTVIGLALAWLTTRTDLPGRRFVTVLAVVPLAVPGYVMAYALLSLGGNLGLAAELFGWAIPRPTGFVGALLALTLYCYPYVFLNVRSALAGFDPSIEESARSLGYRPRQVFLRVVLPLLFPALFASWVIVGLYVFGDFGAVALMRFEVFSYAIFTQYSGAFDRVYAAVLSLMLLALAAIPMLGEMWHLRRARVARVGSGVARVAPRIPLGTYKPLAITFVLVIVGASVVLPVGTLVSWMVIRPPWGALGDVLGAFANSVLASAPAAAGAVLPALPIAYLRVRYPSRMSGFAERVAYVGYAVPPLAFALALVFFALRAAPFLYQTLPLLVGAYALSFLALAMGPIRSTLLQAPRRLEEAARSVGYRPVTAFVRAILPLLRRGILASLMLVFVMALKELPIAFLLAPTGFTTLSVAVFTRTSEAMMTAAAPYAFAIVLCSCLFVGLLLRYEGGPYPAQ